MAKIIEAKAVISGEEKLSPLLDRLSKKFEQVAKTAKASEGVGKMADQLNRVKTQLAAIEKFNASKMSFANSRTNFREAELAVQRAARAMQEGKAPAAELEAAYKRAQSAVTAASRSFENQKAAVISAARALNEFGVPINKVVAEQERLAGAINRANSALDKQASKGSRLRAAAGNAASMAGMLAGPAILRGTKAAVMSGANIQSEVVKMRAAGVPEADIQRELGHSASLAAKYTNVGRGTILERYKELRSVLLHPDEATQLLEPTIRANAAMNAIDKSGHMAEGLQFAVKGAEVLGLAQDPKRFTAYLDAFVKAQQVMGKTITPEQMFEFAKYTKASGTTLSDRFKFTTGVSLSQEMGGSTTGVSIDQFVKQITGGFQGSQHSAAKEFVALGLAKKSDFETTKTGAIKGLKHGRHVMGADLAQTDPDLYVSKYLLPALISHGYKDQNAQIQQVRRMFPSTRAADLVSKLITQAPSFANHAKLYESAQGLNAIDNNQTDAGVALNSLTTALNSFAGTLTSPIMQNAAGVLSSMATQIGGWSESLERWQKSNPLAAQIGGGAAIAGGVGLGGLMTYNLVSGLMGGFGLSASAVALDASAAALTSAAAALGGGAVGKAGGVVAGAAGATPWLSRAAPFLGYGGLAIGGAAALYGMYEAAKPFAGMSLNERLTATRGGSMNDAYRKAFNDDRERLGIPALGNSGGAVQAELTGSAKVTGEAKITIDIPGLLSRIINVPLNGNVSANGPGSLGTSSPDAGAFPVGQHP